MRVVMRSFFMKMFGVWRSKCHSVGGFFYIAFWKYVVWHFQELLAEFDVRNRISLQFAF